ncbi:MAG TPA: sensor domain-containing diguanylate cyclase [Terriglobales bacterium]|nr:sensor domain-containing diguanylate cyclase [Terriglobales bacterium]
MRNMQKIAVLYDASQAVLSTFDLDEVLSRILSIARDYFHLQNVSILLLEQETQELVLKSQIGWPKDADVVRLPLGKGLTGTAAQQKRPVYAPDVTQDPRYVTSAVQTRSELAVPLMVREEVVGVLDCQSEKLDFFDRETIDLLTLFSTQASMALQNAKLYSLERRRAQQLEAINSIAQQMTAVLEITELLGKVCTLIGTAFDVDHVAVMLKEDNELVLRSHCGNLTPVLPMDGRVPATSGTWGRALMSGRTLVENEIGQHDRERLCQEARSRMCIPLVSFGQRLGVLILSNTKSDTFEAADQQSLESVADICATAIQNAHHVERVRQLAYIDGLTGIFNRRFFEMRIAEEIERARRFDTRMALIMIDIDQFKRLNDEFGHLLGDEVLRQVSSIFSQHLRKIDVLCRYGGEEFIIALSQTDPESAFGVADKLRKVVAAWQFPGVPRSVTISAGVAVLPEDGINRDDLVKVADSALYLAKQSGRNRVCTAHDAGKSATAGR